MLSIDDGGLNLGLSTTVEGSDALLRIGADAESGFLIASDTNRFDSALTGIDVEVLAVGSQPATVTVTLDRSKIEKSIQSFVDSYNKFGKLGLIATGLADIEDF